jgi:hypothetical protein
MRYSGFPRVGHLPGSSHTPEDVLLSEEEAADFLAAEVQAQEKLDGINVSLRRTGATRVEVGLKIEWSRALAGGVRRAVDIWVRQHERALCELLARGETLYGEWLWHEVSVAYDRLPALLVGFALEDKKRKFVHFDEVAERLRAVGLEPATPIFRGQLRTMKKVRSLVGDSRVGPVRMEGVIIERLDGGWPRWCKWVEQDYPHPVPGKISGRKNRLRAPARR